MVDPKPKRVPRALPSAAASLDAALPEAGVVEPILEPEAPAAEPAQTFAPELPPPQPPVAKTPTSEDPWAALSETQAALARGLEEFAAEVTGMTRTGVSAGADAAIALLGSRTLAEAVQINAGLVRRQVDAMMIGSARLSEICLKAFTDASRPVLTRLGSV